MAHKTNEYKSLMKKKGSPMDMPPIKRVKPKRIGKMGIPAKKGYV